MDYLQLAKKNEELLLKFRKHLHENPELSGQETQTIKYIDENLTQFRIPHIVVEDGGIIGFIKGRKDGKSILLRADCDALPIDEDICTFGRKKPYISSNPGVMHACGHDFHTSSLLVSAKILNELKSEFDGDVVLLFERSEEKGGPYLENLLKYIEDNNVKVDTGYAIHVGPGKAGIFEFASGPSSAGVFVFQYTIKGKGGHGSRPDLAINPIGCFQAIAARIDQLRMTKVNPYEPVTLTICTVNSGMAANIIPETLTFSGNGRFFNKEEAGIPLAENLKRIVRMSAESYNCEIIEEFVSPLGESTYTAPQCAELAKSVFETEFTKDDYFSPKDYRPTMGSESFSKISARYPSIMLKFGVTNEEDGVIASIHHPKFDIDLSQAYRAPAFSVAYAIRYLNS